MIAFEHGVRKLIEKGYIKKLDPMPMINPLSQGYKAYQTCTYHQLPGHNTDHCMRLKHEIRVLIEKGVTTPPPIMQSKCQCLNAIIESKQS